MLSEEIGAHWSFEPSERTIERGDSVTAKNFGGEFHTFTEVEQFGKGCIEELNGAVEDEPPVLILGVGPCPEDPQQLGRVFGASGLVPDGKLAFQNLSVGAGRRACGPGSDLIVAFTLARAVRGKLTVTLSARTGAASGPAASADGFTMTATVNGQTPVALRITTATGTASSDRPDLALHVVDNEVHIRLPSEILEPLGPRWHWTAAATSPSRTGRCPSSGATGADRAVQVATPLGGSG